MYGCVIVKLSKREFQNWGSRPGMLATKILMCDFAASVQYDCILSQARSKNDMSVVVPKPKVSVSRMRSLSPECLESR